MKFKIRFDELNNTDLHMHTTFSDGHDDPEDMIKAAISKGMYTIGISDHSYTFFDDSYCIAKNRAKEYKDKINELKEKFKADDINIYLGIEQDYYSTEPTYDYDYVIGSAHYVKKNIKHAPLMQAYLHAAESDISYTRAKFLPCGIIIFKDAAYIPVDETPDLLTEAVRLFYNGDIYALAEDYFMTVSDVLDKTGADIVGHFDLITKFNEKYDLFDTTHPRYVQAWKKAADHLLAKGALFEINTGAISRGWRTCPYPSDEIIRYIIGNGGRFIYSSDAHSASNIAFYFDRLHY